MFFSRSKPQADDPFFVWSDAEHSVGISRFDEEHKRLASMLNHVHAVLVKQRDRTQAIQLMERLIQETRDHFMSEERALQESGFGELEAHLKEHSALLQEAEDLVKRFKGGGVSALALPTFLKSWLISHIKGSDRKYAACLRRGGIR